MSGPTFQGPTSGQYAIPAPQASHGGTINFHFAHQAHAQPPTPFSTVPFPPDPDFIGRPDIAAWLREKFARPGRRAALVGLGGVGKSQVAIQYAHDVRQQSPSTWVFWVHASTRARFEEAYRGIAGRLQLPQRDDPKIDVLRLVSDWLCSEDKGPWLMILDNADDDKMFYSDEKDADRQLAAYVPKTGKGSVLVTSRSMNAAEALTGNHNNIYNVPVMDSAQALRLLRERLGRNYDEDAGSNLVRALDYMPLAIAQAAAFINRRAPRMSIAAYLDEFCRSDKKKASLLNRDARDVRRDESAANSVMTTWRITFEQIQQERRTAAELLSLMSFFNPQGIPESVLLAYEQGLVEDWGPDEEERFEEDLEVLRGYSLVAVTTESTVFEMHALVQFCTREWLMSFGDAQRWRREFLRAMSNSYPPGEYENWTKCQQLEPHIETLIRGPLDDEVAGWAELATNAGWYRWMRGWYIEAERMLREAVNIRKRTTGLGDGSTLTSISKLALILQGQGKYEEAEQMSRQALGGREKVLGQEHPDTLTSINNLAVVLQYQGKYEEAEQMNRQALEGYKKVLGQEHPDTLSSIDNLASVMRDHGKYEESEQMSRQAVRGKEKVLGQEHPDTLRCINNLALVLQYQGKYEEAEQINRQALEGYEKVLGQEHPDTLISINNLASVLQLQGKYEEAEKMNRRALGEREKVLGQEHPDTLISINNLASVLQSQGKYEEAEQMNRQALGGYEKVLGQEHPDALTSINNLASVLQYQGKYEEAEQMNRQALGGREKVLGREHPDTLISINDLALVLQRQGKYEEAENMNWRALEGYKRVLGQEHPNTLISINNLASVLQLQGKYEEAEKMNRRALGGREKVLGQEHPDTLTSVYCLAYLLHRRGRPDEAAMLYERAYRGFVDIIGLNHPRTTACAEHRRFLGEEMDGIHDI